jgi:hypothetical protein
MKAAVLLIFLFLAAEAAESPLWVRLQTGVSSIRSVPGSLVESLVTQDFSSPAGFVIPMGSRVTGKILQPARRSTLKMSFEAVWITGRVFPLQAHVLEVDNARERVEPDGTIVGLDPIPKRPSRVDVILLAAAYAHPAILASLETGKYVIRKVERPEVRYPAGTDVALRIVEFPAVASSGSVLKPDPVTPEPLAHILQQLPDRTEAKHLSLPSDWINITLLGARESLASAFARAGWDTADQLSIRTEAKTFFAVADYHSYQSAPVSTLLVAGKMPDLVFQKQTNTFAKRHHIRIWSTQQTWNGQPIWIAAATHDIGIDFSRRARTFTHRVGSDVDLERLKVVDDLRFAGRVALCDYVDRPSIPRQSENGTGDIVLTDGRLAVLDLRP